MKFFKVAILLFALIATPAFAQCDIANVSGLTAVAKQELKVACQQAMLKAEQMADNPLAGVDVSDPDKLSQWGVVAQEWARALGVAANELGLAADSFLDTDAGKLTAAIIIWHVLGETLLGFVVGVPLLAVVLFLGIRTARRAKIKSVTYGDEKNWHGAREVKEIIYFDEDETAMYWVAYIVTLILSIWIVAGVIF